MTGLLYLIVIGMWGAVLFPIFLKKYDQTQVKKSVGIIQEKAVWHWQAKAEATPRQQAFVRRRRVVMTLLTALILSFIAGLSDVISIYWSVLPLLLLVAFVYIAITQGQKLTQPKVRPKTAESPLEVPTAQQDTVVIAVQAPAEETSTETVPWQPVDPPLPTYVTAARATAIPRAIDAQAPWTGQAMVEQAVKLRTEQAERIKSAQKRLEEARALSMEKARRAALAHRAATANSSQIETPQAVNE